MSSQLVSPTATVPESPALELTKAIALFDPLHIMRDLQQLFPFSAISGVDLVRLTEIQEKSLASLKAAVDLEREFVFSTGKREYEMLNACFNDIMDAMKQMSMARDPVEASTKQTEVAVQIVDRLSQETVQVLQNFRAQHMDIFKTLA